jgi:hypothetical protein
MPTWLSTQVRAESNVDLTVRLLWRGRLHSGFDASKRRTVDTTVLAE